MTLVRDNGGVPEFAPRVLDATSLGKVRYNDQGLIPAVVQEVTTRQVLMLAWMDRDALRRTLDSGRATYWSRSRETHWVKGETSGNAQHVRELRLDCDNDTVLVLVDQVGPACHTGTATCFDDGTGQLTPPRRAPREG